MTDTLQVQPEGQEPEGLNEAEKAAIDAVDKKGAELDKLQQDQDKSGEPSRPDWLPEKFKSAEDMAAAYQELEKKLGGGEPAKEEPSADQKTDDKPDDGQPKSFDLEAVAKEFARDGKLSEETLKAAQEAGVPEGLLDTLTAGIAKQITDARAQVFDSVGGEEKFTEITKWASANMTPEDLQAYNDAVDSGDLAKASSELASIKEKFVEANGEEGTLEKGMPTPKGVAQFRSRAELTAAMSDPRYAKDPAYRDEVTKKLANSSIL